MAGGKVDNKESVVGGEVVGLEIEGCNSGEWIIGDDKVNAKVVTKEDGVDVVVIAEEGSVADRVGVTV